jgi:hypothetical protein
MHFMRRAIRSGETQAPGSLCHSAPGNCPREFIAGISDAEHVRKLRDDLYEALQDHCVNGLAQLHREMSIIRWQHRATRTRNWHRAKKSLTEECGWKGGGVGSGKGRMETPVVLLYPTIKGRYCSTVMIRSFAVAVHMLVEFANFPLGAFAFAAPRAVRTASIPIPCY